MTDFQRSAAVSANSRAIRKTCTFNCAPFDALSKSAEKGSFSGRVFGISDDFRRRCLVSDSARVSGRLSIFTGVSATRA